MKKIILFFICWIFILNFIPSGWAKPCPSCSQDNPDRAKFCGYCGTGFATTSLSRKANSSATTENTNVTIKSNEQREGAGKFSIGGEVAFCPQLGSYATASGGTVPSYMIYGGRAEYTLNSNLGGGVVYDFWSQSWSIGTYYDYTSKTYKTASMNATASFVYPYIIYYSRSPGPLKFFASAGLVSMSLLFTTNIPGYTYPFYYIPSYYTYAAAAGIKFALSPKLSVNGEVRIYSDVLIYLGGVNFTF